MKYRLLGNSGLRVSEAALGAMTFGEDWGWGAPKDEARKVHTPSATLAGISLIRRMSTPTAPANRFSAMAKALNVGVTAWSPLAGGVLTGKYQKGESGRMSSKMMKEFMPGQQRTDGIVAALKTVSEQIDRSMAQVALAWLQSRPVPIIPIIGARKLSQLQDNLASFDVTLSADQVKTLDDASQIELGFPQHLFLRELPRTLLYGGMREQILV